MFIKKEHGGKTDRGKKVKVTKRENTDNDGIQFWFIGSTKTGIDLCCRSIL